jgi:hypothetical protein
MRGKRRDKWEPKKMLTEYSVVSQLIYLTHIDNLKSVVFIISVADFLKYC